MRTYSRLRQTDVLLLLDDGEAAAVTVADHLAVAVAEQNKQTLVVELVSGDRPRRCHFNCFVRFLNSYWK